LDAEFVRVVLVADDLALLEDEVALVVLEWPLVELERVVEETLAGLEHLGAYRLRHRLAERPDDDHLAPESAAVTIGGVAACLPRLAAAAALRRVPLRAGQETGGRERAPVGVVAAAHDAAALRVRDRARRAVDVGDDHVDEMVDPAVDGLGLLDRIVPGAG